MQCAVVVVVLQFVVIHIDDVRMVEFVKFVKFVFIQFFIELNVVRRNRLLDQQAARRHSDQPGS